MHKYSEQEMAMDDELLSAIPRAKVPVRDGISQSVSFLFIILTRYTEIYARGRKDKSYIRKRK